MTIGPRCTLCKKQKRLHGGKELACPVGKKLAGAFFFFHATDTFQSRPPKLRTSKIPAKKKRGGAESRKDRSVRRAARLEPCAACGKGPTEACHIRTWKVSQCDAAFNILSMCRFHHNEQHQWSWYAMANTYPGIMKALKERGWEFVETSRGEWSIFNEKEVEMNRQRRAL